MLRTTGRGKHVGRFSYYHRTLAETREGVLARLEGIQRQLHDEPLAFNVVKLDARSCVSFLWYGEFESAAFPTLVAALTCDMSRGTARRTDYSGRRNPPILHRKELLLPADSRLVPDATRLTEELERLGAFDAPTPDWHQGWLDHAVGVAGCEFGWRRAGDLRMSSGIERQRTALRRVHISAPMRHLLRFGFLDGAHSVFDYGCGRGDDLRLLAAMNIPATGWDPVYRPDSIREPADVVNLGFVLNVIEDAAERRETLRSAFALARKVLVIGVMLGYQREREQFTAFRDGVITRRNTFQKYFTQDEFRSYVEETLEANAVPVAAGICLVFRNPADEQLFLLARQQVLRRWRLVRREPHSEAVAPLIGQHREQMDAYWLRALELGRPPVAEECPEAESLAGLVGSWRRVHDWVASFFDTEQLDAATIGRQEDLLVYFALGHFSRWRPYTEMPARLKRDVKVFFGNVTKARNAGKRALFAAGDRSRLEEAAVFCHEELGIGKLHVQRHLTLHQSVLGECLPLVRIYVGCALQLFGEAGSVDLIKVYLKSGKVTFLVYDDFDGAEAPMLVERIKVDLERQRVDFFDYVGPFEPQPLEDLREEFFAGRT